ncbi:DUF3472 domain-containing protein [Mucilaginibacter flavus]|uniref:DUF3472 domain-containing protein n=1 Tax=Mucilaginibacter flavus TaxID=931504 RepID=UPI0025B4D39F|nr:DUF3472 domain-containing protein [Mucilaginibacter flavus]MDN3583143.1 DUF3472 domain-containing protein [Mucilaginibacter flavus]
MKKVINIYIPVICVLLFSNAAGAKTRASADTTLRKIIPVGGNAWTSAPAIITDEGLTHWTSAASVSTIYFRVSVKQPIQLFLRLRVHQGESTIRVTFGNKIIDKKINNTVFDTIAIGKINVARPGHVKVNLQGIAKAGDVYADVTDVIIKTNKADNDMAYVKQGSSFYFGKRGPSVHLRFDVPRNVQGKVKWFYNEIHVPKGGDILGSYFMADGFGQGYFGMQVNSPTERRVLFSVWSPYDTQDPKSIPENMRIKPLLRGEGVHIGEFGDEGSGGQSYMNYPWVAGQSYAFLLKAEPDAATNSTTFTAWFKDVSANKWMLIASFNRPKVATYLSDLYSFVENFDPDYGDKTRKAFFTNQWIADTDNNWIELTKAMYTGDATANANYRKDYAGGADATDFYLKNGGFFDNYKPLRTIIDRKPLGVKPVIDFDKLPLK